MAKKKVFQISTALGDGLEETITAAHNYSGDLRVDVIPLKKIAVDPENPRDLTVTFDDLFFGISEVDPEGAKKRLEIESLQSLAHSIKEQGIINPIVVYKYGEKYRLIAGERRTLASIIAGKSDIQAKILESKPNEHKISLLQWIENIERSDLSLWERIRNLEKIVATYAAKRNVSIDQVTITELSDLIGCSKSHAMNYMAVLRCDENLKNLIIENKIKNLEKAALIADINDKQVKEHIIHECLAGSPLKKLKTIVEQHKLKKVAQKPKETRGRQTTLINLGVTKNAHVAKLILDSVLNHHSLNHINESFQAVDWNDCRSVTGAFKELLKKLEELHA